MLAVPGRAVVHETARQMLYVILNKSNEALMNPQVRRAAAVATVDDHGASSSAQRIRAFRLVSSGQAKS